ncbi:HEPN domain-containing protein [Sediminibacterium soli]|uniref:HEPN domain-containing protein n=1 Tax=Sediminibacterium soli TaxID=2698829 RepID=UPI00137B0F2A|nr:HEPN domain-containing protein [Sediminibacterium soli]NCI48229.1 HEPN domain-containing protein [Sediminibacterium soli]
MISFQEKAKQNLLAAQALITQHLYHSSVNRSYYATFQYGLYVLFEKIRISKEELNAEAFYEKKGSHVLAFKRLGTEIAGKDISDYRWFQRVSREFKALRKSADYTEETITVDQANDSIRNAESIIRTLLKHFK